MHDNLPRCCSRLALRGAPIALLLILMIFTVPLRAGTSHLNVLWYWLVSGAPTVPSGSGVTQPDSQFPQFRIDTGAAAPAGAEELIVYDSTDLTNWNPGGYRAGLAAVAAAQQILLVSLYQPSAGTMLIAPANPAALSICRCYGTFKDVNNVPIDGEPVTITLVAQDQTDPTIIYDLSSTPLINTETNLLIGQRVVNGMIVAGQLQDANANPYIDLVRHDYIKAAGQVAIPAGSALQYVIQCTALGAPIGLATLPLGSSGTFTPIVFRLDTSTILQTSSGTYNISAKSATGSPGSPLPVAQSVIWEFHPEIVSFNGSAPSLCGTIPTLAKAVGSYIEIIVDAGGGNLQRQGYQLLAGAYDNTDPGQGPPFDFDASINIKHWEEVG